MLDLSKKSAAQKEIEDFLAARVVGQSEAIKAIGQILQLYRCKLHQPGRPIGNLLFLGPTGTGKTRIVEVLAEYFFGKPHAVTKIDCAEYQHSHEIAKLVGSPPGYLGHRETHPMLSQENLKQHHTDKCNISLVLFDEIEKASDSLWNLLLGIMDKATLTLGDNRRVDFSNCIIFATSNVGSREMSKITAPKMGFNGTGNVVSTNQLSSAASRAAKRKFTPEFLNRFDQIVTFNPLTKESFRTILDIELQYIENRIKKDSGFWFVVTDRLREHLISKGTSAEYGVRHLKRLLEIELVLPAANLLDTQ